MHCKLTVILYFYDIQYTISLLLLLHLIPINDMNKTGRKYKRIDME